MVKKDFTIIVDNTTVQKDIKLLLGFLNLSRGDDEKVAWQVSEVKYKAGVDQEVPVHWESTIGFALASKDEDSVIHAGQSITMDPLRRNVKVALDDENKLVFKNITESKKLDPNQISVDNVTKDKPIVAVGFFNGTSTALTTAGYINGLGKNTEWTVTYRPELSLWIVSDGVTGQTFDTIQMSTNPVHTWNLAQPLDTPNNSRWVLYMDKNEGYCIIPEERYEHPSSEPVPTPSTPSENSPQQASDQPFPVDPPSPFKEPSVVEGTSIAKSKEPIHKPIQWDLLDIKPFIVYLGVLYLLILLCLALLLSCSVLMLLHLVSINHTA